MPWGAAAEYVSPYTSRHTNVPPLASAEPHGSLINHNTAFRNTWYNSSLESSASRPSQAPEHSDQCVDNPPLVRPANLQDTMVEPECIMPIEPSSPQPIRRTKVSITEIVEDIPEQPPTPTSIAGSLKRKADVLDDEVEETMPHSVPAQDSAQVAPVTVIANVPNPSVPERPKKRLRNALGGAAKTIAGLLIPGTVIAVGALTQLPEAFWNP